MRSVHFRHALDKKNNEAQTHYSGQVLSLFDIMATTLREQQEKTYSAPFSAHLFSKDMVDTAQGQIRTYPRLKYGGSHLNDPASERVGNIFLNTVFAIFVRKIHRKHNL